MEKLICSSQSVLLARRPACFSYLCDLLVVWNFVVNLAQVVVARFDREEGRQPKSSKTEPELFPLGLSFLRLKGDFSTEKSLMLIRTTMLIFSQTFNSLCVRDRQKHSLINQHCLDTFLFSSTKRPSLFDFREVSRRLVQPSLLSFQLAERLG